MDFTWTKEADAIITQMWGTASTSAIADRINREFRVSVSRSAVGGRAKRINLPLLLRKAKSKQKSTIDRRHNPVNFHTMRAGPSLEAAPIPEPRATDAPPELRISLMDPRFDRDNCRYFLGNVGESGAGFCPEKHLEGHSYCPEHARRCARL